MMQSTGSSIVIASSTGGSARSRRATRKKLRARLGRKRQRKIEREGTPAESEAPGPSPTVEHFASRASVESPEISQPLNEGDPSTAADIRPSGPKRFGTLSLRPPPVFRSQTEAMLWTSSGTQISRPNMRRAHSGPNLPSNNLATHESQKAASPLGTELSSKPELSKKASVVLLVMSTALVALCAEYMVESINHLVMNTPLSEAFIGLIIIPIVGNAAEHVTAVVVAARNKMDLAIGVAIGSSIQIAMLITPVIVIIGWIIGKDMPLYFTLFETVALFVTTFVVNFLVLGNYTLHKQLYLSRLTEVPDGRSNYLEGSLLCSSYIIIA